MRLSFLAACIFLLPLAIPQLASAQRRRQRPKPPQLSAKAESTLARLNSFGALPAKQWRYHVGNIPNGQDPNLDVSSWQTITLPKRHLPAQAVWFRREIVVPPTLNGYDLTNSRIELSFRIRSRGDAPLIVFMDGRRVALGADLAPIVLWQKAKPGDRTLVAVKALATNSAKFVATPRVTITTDPARPSPSDLYKEVQSASWLLPVLPGGKARVHALEEAVDAVDTNDLDEDNQAGFDTSLKKAQQILDPLNPLLKKADIHLVGNSHMDVAWLWPWTETVHTVRHTLGTSLQLMDEYPQYTFTQSTALYFKWMQNKYPSMFSEIQKRVKQGRFELVGGMWVEPDLNMPSGESQVRQILYAKRYFEKNFGVNVRVGWNPDSFGYNWQLPQIYKKSGIYYFLTQKMSWNDTNKLPLKLFWWESPDGSRVLTYFPHGYGNRTNPITMAEDYSQLVKFNPGIHRMMFLYGVGDHGGGPTRVMVNQALHWEKPNKVFPHLDFGTSLSFFQTVKQHLATANLPVWNYKTFAAGDTALPQPPPGKISLPVWDDELYLEFHRGTYTTQTAQKRNIRDSEEWMLNAEKYSSLAWLGGEKYPDKMLTTAWEKVLMNEFHDLAAGSGIADIYRDAAKQFQVVHFKANQATSQALKLLTSYIDTETPKGTASLLVFNPMAWTRTDIVEAKVQLPEAAQSIAIEDPQGHKLPVQILGRTPETHTFDVLFLARNVPALGYEKLTVAPAEPTSPHYGLQIHGTTLENKYLRVVVDPKTGCITSLYDKPGKFETIAKGGCGNQLQAFHNNPTSYDAWNINPNYWKHPYSLGPAFGVKVVESGPLRAEIQVEHATKKSKFVQDIVLYAGLDRVDVENNIDWHEHHILLKAAFPLSASAPYATYNIPYGNIRRPTTRNNSVQKAKFEVSAIRWADLGNKNHGFSLINNSKYGYDGKGNVLRLTVLRSATYPDPTADLGKQHFVYSLYPHAGTWKQALTPRHGWDFNYKLKAVQVEKHAGTLPAEHSFFKVEPDNVILDVVKKAEDSNALILRFYEWAGKDTQVKIQLPHGATSAIATNLMEIPHGAPIPIHDNSVTVEAKPYSIDTIKVEFSGRGPKYWNEAIASR